MKPDPIFSGEALKAIALLVVAIVLGGAAVAVATGDLGVDLPDIDLPDPEPSTDPTVTLSNTDLSDITINEADDLVEPEPEVAPEAAPVNQFDGSAFQAAIERVVAELGPGARASSVLINDSQTQFVMLTGGKEVRAYSVLSSGDLVTQDASVSITGNATLENFAFKIAAIPAGGIDRMIRKAGRLAGVRTFRPTTLRLERDLSGGLRPPEWTINAEGDGRYLTFRADLEGKRIEEVGGGGVQIPQAAIDTRKLGDCLKAAAQDFERVQACFDEFRG